MGGVLSLGLAKLSTNSFSSAFVAHAGIMALLFALAFRALGPARRDRRRSLGLRVIRADDLLFRWGGDEFLILFNLNEMEARRRLSDIEQRLELTKLAVADAAVIVSHGLATFAATDEIERAIDPADGAMYARKQARKAGQLVS